MSLRPQYKTGEVVSNTYLGGLQPIVAAWGLNVIRRFVWRILATVGLCYSCLVPGPGGQVFAAENATQARPQLNAADRARQDFVQARARYNAAATNSEAAWQFARACFDLAEFADSNSERAEIAETGIGVARRLVAQDPGLAEAHYYLGMNLGQLARTKSLGALRLVDQMEETFLTSRRLDEKLDYAGSDRNLGLLYLEAPSIGSIGSRSKARVHLRRAVELAPDYPENRLILAEAYVRWRDEAAAKREFKVLTDNWRRYRQQFSGEKWQVSWTDWTTRFEKLREKLGASTPKLEAPSQSTR